MEIFKEYTFEAAHKLPLMPEGHPCGRLHGHSWKAVLYLEGEVNELGWIMDFGEIDKRFEPILSQLDHYYLNDVEGLENPTCENIAQWIWNQLKPNLKGLSKVAVWETVNSGGVYAG